MDYHYLEAIKTVSQEAYDYITTLTKEEKNKINYLEHGETLVNFFLWEDSPQGFNFWLNIYEGVKNIGKTYISWDLARIINRIKPFSFSFVDNDYCTLCLYGFAFDYIDLGADDKTRISVMRKGWDPPPTTEERREKGLFLKPGKLLAALFPLLPPRELSLLADQLASALRFSRDFTFSGLQISSVPSALYTTDHSGITSCMIGASRARFAIYDQIPGCRILYKTDDSGSIIGRALVWERVENDFSNNLITLMDRVYYNDDDTLQEFLKYAACQGWYRKERQCIDGRDIVAPNGGIERDCILSVDLETELDLEECPYLDTFFIETNKGTLTNTYPNWPETIKTEFRSTAGYDSNGVYLQEGGKCSQCGGSFHEDDLYYVDDYPYCEDCRDGLFQYVECCSEYVGHDDAIWIESERRYICQSCFDHEYFICTQCGEAFHSDDAVVTVDGEGYCGHCAERHLEQCAECGEWHESGLLEEIEGYTYCQDCIDKKGWFTCPDCNEWVTDGGPCECQKGEEEEEIDRLFQLTELRRAA